MSVVRDARNQRGWRNKRVWSKQLSNLENLRNQCLSIIRKQLPEQKKTKNIMDDKVGFSSRRGEQSL